MHMMLYNNNIGGSSGTGHGALQVAKGLGANNLVTICLTRKVDFVKECGATRVVDYSMIATNDDMVQELFCDEPEDKC
jgi:NADPH:quinone reductase-like Zn-dependent oxidoreductase